MAKPSTDHRTARWSRETAALLIVALVNVLLLWHFHDRYWYPTDDGFYANIAERLLRGELLHRDIQDIHPGYIHLINAAAMRAFGLDIVTLRYPLIAAALAQSLFVFVLVRPAGIAAAAACSITSVTLGVLQFIDPTPNWYCLALVTVLAWWLAQSRRRYRLVGAGLLVGCITMLRQLSGVWAAMGTLTIALLEQQPQGAEEGRGRIARTLFVVMAAALCWYLVVSPATEIGGVVLIAVWPLAVLAWGAVRARTPEAVAAGVCGSLVAGGLIPVIPVAIYHVAHGSAGAWFGDTILAAFGETQMGFFASGWYGVLPIAAAYRVLTSFSMAGVSNGLYWMMLPLLFAVNGAYVLRYVSRRGNVRLIALPILAAFYALVSLYLEGPLYLYYSVGLVIASVVWWCGQLPVWRKLAPAAAFGLAAVAVYFHAGQTRIRTPVQTLEGQRLSDTWSDARRSPLARASLLIEEPDRTRYATLIAAIERQTRPDDAIWVLPNDAELYFLANRRNPLRFYNSALGVRTESDQQALLKQLDEHPPRLVVYRPDDKYNTPLMEPVVRAISARSENSWELDGWEFYQIVDVSNMTTASVATH